MVAPSPPTSRASSPVSSFFEPQPLSQLPQKPIAVSSSLKELQTAAVAQIKTRKISLLPLSRVSHTTETEDGSTLITKRVSLTFIARYGTGEGFSDPVSATFNREEVKEQQGCRGPFHTSSLHYFTSPAACHPLFVPLLDFFAEWQKEHGKPGELLIPEAISTAILSWQKEEEWMATFGSLSVFQHPPFPSIEWLSEEEKQMIPLYVEILSCLLAFYRHLRVVDPQLVPSLDLSCFYEKIFALPELQITDSVVGIIFGKKGIPVMVASPWGLAYTGMKYSPSSYAQPSFRTEKERLRSAIVPFGYAGDAPSLPLTKRVSPLSQEQVTESWQNIRQHVFAQLNQREKQRLAQPRVYHSFPVSLDPMQKKAEEEIYQRKLIVKAVVLPYASSKNSSYPPGPHPLCVLSVRMAYSDPTEPSPELMKAELEMLHSPLPQAPLEQGAQETSSFPAQPFAPALFNYAFLWGKANQHIKTSWSFSQLPGIVAAQKKWMQEEIETERLGFFHHPKIALQMQKDPLPQELANRLPYFKKALQTAFSLARLVHAVTGHIPRVRSLYPRIQASPLQLTPESPIAIFSIHEVITEWGVLSFSTPPQTQEQCLPHLLPAGHGPGERPLYTLEESSPHFTFKAPEELLSQEEVDRCWHLIRDPLFCELATQEATE